MNALSGIAFAPLVPWPLLAALAGVALAVWLLALGRRARGAWARAIPLAALLVALANPRLVTEERQPLPDIAVVVVDDTLSQGIGDRRAQTEAALAQIRQRLAHEPNLDVRIERVGNRDGEDQGTRLFAAVDHALADVPKRRLAGVLMITDGEVHDVPEDLGRSLGAPVHVLLSGRPGEVDRRLVLRDGPKFALVGRSAAVRLRVEEPGGTGAARVDVRVDGQPYLAAQVPLNRDTSIEVPVRHAGQTVVELAAEPGPHELSLANNRVAFAISGIRDRLKVLLISGEPNAGERTWRDLLKADPAVALVHFTILRPPEKDDFTPIRELSLITFPVRELFEEKLSQFDLVIFDRYRRRGVLSANYYKALADYVRNGGALLAAVGPEFAEPDGLFAAPLAEIMPAEPTGTVLARPFRPTITALGRRHPVTAGFDTGAKPWGRWLRQMAVRQKSGVAVLAGLDNRPLIILDRVGEGRVAEVLSDTFWLWARGWEGGGPYNELLRRLAHWLMKEPDLEEDSLSAEVKGSRIEVTRRSLDTVPETVTVTRPDGSTASLPLVDQGGGRATASMEAGQAGLWRVEDGQRSAVAVIGSPNPIELSELAATAARLSPVAQATGGAVHWLVDGGLPEIRRVPAGGVASGRGWIGLLARDDHSVTGLREVPLIPGGVLLVLAIGGLLWTWRREGR
ncbi:MAG: hypothetical protein M0006_05425 [Magnetospirillum sp.]|nr:hypothetical protein [Magnetospirillum sp.]